MKIDLISPEGLFNRSKLRCLMEINWIRVKDKVPDKIFFECIIYDETLHYKDIYYSGDGIALAEYEERGLFRVNSGQLVSPTHWMPVPCAPKKEN